MKYFLSRFLLILCAAIAGFATCRLTWNCDRYAVVPSYTAAAFHATADGKITPAKDTNDLNAVQGLQGPYVHHVYTLDSITFNAYYFNSGWTAYVKSGGYIKDTTLFVVYQRKPVCVSAAVRGLITAKYLGR